MGAKEDQRKVVWEKPIERVPIRLPRLKGEYIDKEDKSVNNCKTIGNIFQLLNVKGKD